MQYDVISPDGFSIERDAVYNSLIEATQALEKWRERYERQGYYSSVKYGRIPLDELNQYCRILILNHKN
jgi:hypothetical protein